MARSKSENLMARSRVRIPGGVNSPVRSWSAVGKSPRFIKRGHAAYLFDVDGKKYLDYVGSWGPLIFGHANSEIAKAIKKALERGTTFGAPTEGEAELAEMVHTMVPSIDKLRLVSSGTEATMSAIRLSRAYTKRDKVLKFDGCYHGHVDSMLVQSGSGVATFSLPDSPGIPNAYTQETLVASFNDIDNLEAVFREYTDVIAAVIIEPICGNMGVIPPAPEFLHALREITKDHGTVLIFDEVITGFRVSAKGAQGLYGVTPDLTCLGKILGGGLPLGAFGGRQDIMDLLAPEGPVYQAGTLSGNPLAVAAGITTLKLLSRREPYLELDEKGSQLQCGMEDTLSKHHFRATVNRVGSMFTVFFGVDGVRNAEEARCCDRECFARFFHGMLDRGVYLPPSPFEAAFVSLAHQRRDLKKTLEAFENWAKEESRG
ncbi:MAG: glutamate-1-semialdehyde 2,1-aminomutase [Deltaproteobacteria bacterium]|nr:glutamate-1-semialdehyde 2,1-aminomutase [Deltaproteobacteria bacterium]